MHISYVNVIDRCCGHGAEEEARLSPGDGVAAIQVFSDVLIFSSDSVNFSLAFYTW